MSVECHWDHKTVIKLRWIRPPTVLEMLPDLKSVCSVATGRETDVACGLIPKCSYSGAFKWGAVCTAPAPLNKPKGHLQWQQIAMAIVMSSGHKIYPEADTGSLSYRREQQGSRWWVQSLSCCQSCWESIKPPLLPDPLLEIVLVDQQQKGMIYQEPQPRAGGLNAPISRKVHHCRTHEIIQKR